MRNATNVTRVLGQVIGRTAVLCLYLFSIGCAELDAASGETRQTLHALALEDARRCEPVYTYPQALVDGLSAQLIEELRCMDDQLLVWYTPCKAVGCVWNDGPQPLAMRPEVLAALQAAAHSMNDYITISSAYRDVAMQYYSRWYNENCASSFHAAVPGASNHQGGNTIDVRYYSYWWDALLSYGFSHPIPSDKPHFEFRDSPEFRQSSEALKTQSVLAFQRLWNRNYPSDPIAEDGVYGTQTKLRLGASPVEGFTLHGCALEPPIPEGDGEGGDGDGDDTPEELDCRALVEACGAMYPCALLEGTDCIMPDPNPCRGDACDPECVGPSCDDSVLPDNEDGGLAFGELSSTNGCAVVSSGPRSLVALIAGALVVIGLLRLRRRSSSSRMPKRASVGARGSDPSIETAFPDAWLDRIAPTHLKALGRARGEEDATAIYAPLLATSEHRRAHSDDPDATVERAPEIGH